MIQEKELGLAKMLIESLLAGFEPEKYKDNYRENLLKMIQAKVEGKQVTIHSDGRHNGALVSEVVNLLGEQEITFHDLRTEQPNLEDVFLSLTGRAMRE